MREQHGTVRKIGSNWFGAYSTWHQDEAGVKVRRQRTYKIGSVKVLAKTEARRKLRLRVEQELGLRQDRRKTLQWFIENRWQPMREGKWRDSTKATNLEILKYIIARFGNDSLEKLDSVSLQVWLNEAAKKYSGSVVRHLRIFIKAICAEAVEQDFLHKSPARSLALPILKPVKKTYLKVQQVRNLLSKAEGTDLIILRLFFGTGLRPSELFALVWKDFDEKHKLLYINESIYRGDIRPYTKTTDSNSPKELTRVNLPDSLVADLKNLRKTTIFPKNDDYIFTTKWGHAWWKENWLRRQLEPIRKAAGIPRVNFQILRRTVATLAQTLGSRKDIATILRHKNIDTAQLNYVQSQPETVRLTSQKLAGLLGTGTGTAKQPSRFGRFGRFEVNDSADDLSAKSPK
ncbi:MAG: tyrosine-type recombinase/integrase [Terriglobales bacterium]